MKTLKKLSMGFTAWMALTLFVLVLVGFAPPSQAAQEIKLDSLEVGLEVFTNITVLDITKTDVFIRHAGGSANFKLKDLAPETLRKLSGQVEIPVEAKEDSSSLPGRITTTITEQLGDNPQLQALEEQWAAELQQKLPPITKELIAAVLGMTFLFYLFFCYCCKLIVQKTGTKAGLLIWLPVLQVIPLLRAARMSGWWFIFMLLPILGFFATVIATVIWSFKIVEQRGKSVIWAILLLLPLTNCLAFLYLAFSESAARESEPERIRLAEAA